MPAPDPAPRRCPQCDNTMTVGRILGDHTPLRYATTDDAVDLASLRIHSVGHHGRDVPTPFLFSHRCRPCGLVLVVESENRMPRDDATTGGAGHSQSSGLRQAPVGHAGAHHVRPL